MRPMIVGVTLGWLVLGPWCAGDRRRWHAAFVRKDGRLSDHRLHRADALPCGPRRYQACWFRMPRPEPPDAVRVTIRMTKPGGPALEYPATTEAATNKLFHAAQFELPDRAIGRSKSVFMTSRVERWSAT